MPILENIRSRVYDSRPYICKVRYSGRYNASRNIAKRRRIRRKGFYRRVLTGRGTGERTLVGENRVSLMESTDDFDRRRFIPASSAKTGELNTLIIHRRVRIRRWFRADVSANFMKHANDSRVLDKFSIKRTLLPLSLLSYGERVIKKKKKKENSRREIQRI